MSGRTLRVVVRTPREVAAELEVDSLRVPADTGQVGLRPGAEPCVLVVEPGLALARRAGRMRYFATAGGLLRCDGHTVVVLTPVGVTGERPEEVSQRLEAALSSPRAERELRRAIERLEAGLLRELREAGGGRPVPPGGRA